MAPSEIVPLPFAVVQATPALGVIPVLESWLHAARPAIIRIDADEMEPGCPGR